MTTYEQIETVSVGSGGTSSITFSSIPQTYTDLLMKVSARSNRSGTNDVLISYYNGSNSSITGRRIEGVRASGSTFAGGDSFVIAGYVQGNSTTAQIFASSEFYITNYTGSKYKSISCEGAMGNDVLTGVTAWGFSTNLWSSTSAITSITLAPYYGSQFLENTTATLYGIKST